MKNISLILLCIYSFTLIFAQKKEKIEEIDSIKVSILKKNQDVLIKKIKVLQDSLSTIQNSLKEINLHQAITQFKGAQKGKAVLKMDGKILAKPMPISEVIGFLKKGDSIRLINYENNYWLAST